jgi:anti-sigma factor RsiW
MKNNCNSILLDLPDFIQGKMGDSDRRSVQDHIERCPSCRKEAQNLREVFASISSERTPWAPPEAYWNTIIPRIHERLEKRNQSRLIPKWIYRVVLPLAAVLIAVVVIYRSGYFGPVNPEEELRIAVKQMTNEEQADFVRDYTTALSESLDEYPVSDTLLVQYRSEITEAVKSGSFEYSLTPFEYQLAPETLLESLSSEEVEKVLEKMQTHQNIIS